MEIFVSEVIFLIMGFLSFSGFLYYTRWEMNIRKNCDTIQGVVISKHKRWGYANEGFITGIRTFFTRNIAVIEFKPEKHAKHSLAEYTYRNHFIKKHSSVTVQYFRDYPNEARRKPILPFNGAQIIFAVLAILFLYLASIFMIDIKNIQFNSWKLLSSSMRILRRGSVEEIMMFIVFTYGFFLFALLSFVMSAIFIKKEKNSTSWPTVSGNAIGKFKIGVSYSNKNNSPISKLKYFYPDFEYSYFVNGNKYKSSRIRLYAIRTSDLSVIVKLREKFGSNKNVTVYYNPEDPSEAVIEPGLKLHAGIFAPIIGGFSFIAFAFIAMEITYIKFMPMI